jgi:diguanylate cyclase (GGDEF)-like protein
MFQFNPRIYKTSVFVLTLVFFFILSVGISYTTLNKYLVQIELKRQTVELASEVKFLDEQLTAFAYKSIATLEPSYFEAYASASNRLDEVLNLLSINDSMHIDGIYEIVEDNRILLSFEQDAFELAKNYRDVEALNILESIEYQRSKQDYENHLNKYISTITQRYDYEIDANLKSFLASIVFVLISALFFLYSIGLHFYRTLYVVEFEKNLHGLSTELMSNEFNLSFDSVKKILNQMKDISKNDLVYFVFHQDLNKTVYFSDSNFEGETLERFISSLKDFPRHQELYDHQIDYVFDHRLYKDILRLRCCSESAQIIELGFVKVKAKAVYYELGLEALKRFVDAFRLAILKQQSQDELYQLATIDALTQIYNRRSFMEKLNTELLRLHRVESNLSILMLDLDHFKNINDKYGHAIGDEVLKHFALQTQLCLRDVDVFGRIGGEEFSIILGECDLSQAKIVATRIQEQLKKSPLMINQESLDYTVSIGLSKCQKSDDVKCLLERADKALYEAKNHGRNCVKVK